MNKKHLMTTFSLSVFDMFNNNTLNMNDVYSRQASRTYVRYVVTKEKKNS